MHDGNANEAGLHMATGDAGIPHHNAGAMDRFGWHSAALGSWTCDVFQVQCGRACRVVPVEGFCWNEQLMRSILEHEREVLGALLGE